MRNFLALVLLCFIVVSTTSCGSQYATKNSADNHFIGYTLKNKKELMKSKIIPKKGKTIIALP